MQIPHIELDPAVLRKVILEFVTRDGTDDSDIDTRVERVLKHLDAGRAELHFDEDLRTCNILAKEGY